MNELRIPGEPFSLRPEFTLEEKARRKALIHSTFTPNTPINRIDLFSGRERQIDRVLEAVFSPGQHAAIYGERGVGKSSLANIIYDIVLGTGKDSFIPARVNCSAGVTFGEIWREVFKQLPITREGHSYHLDEEIPDVPNSEQIRGLFARIDNPSIIVIDEFDRTDQVTATSMADTIKTLSDRASDTTLVIVGVAESLEQLIEEHASIERSLVQIRMPRMSETELLNIVDAGVKRCELTIDTELRTKIARLSQGLPHYAHVLSKHAALRAVNDSRSHIGRHEYECAIAAAVEDKSQTLGKDYLKATHSPFENIFAEVLLACSLATDKNGFFSAKDVRPPLSQIMKKPYEIQAYIRHLNRFSQEARGPVLKKEGKTRRFQYSFTDSMMQPYVLMKGLSQGMITEEQLHII